MEYVIDVRGKKIPKSYFGNLKEKLDTCRGYVGMYNQMAASKQAPQIDMEKALAKIVKQHNRFYGLDNKYKGDGSLR